MFLCVCPPQCSYSFVYLCVCVCVCRQTGGPNPTQTWRAGPDIVSCFKKVNGHTQQQQQQQHMKLCLVNVSQTRLFLHTES